MEPLLTVNVIESIHGMPQQVVSFPETTEGNQAARELFKRIVKENNEGLSEQDLDDAADDGSLDNVDGHGVFLVHSNAD